MATSDLLTELQKESFKPGSDGEKKICKAILKLLNDQSSDVQGLAVKWCAAAIQSPLFVCFSIKVASYWNGSPTLK